MELIFNAHSCVTNLPPPKGGLEILMDVSTTSYQALIEVAPLTPTERGALAYKEIDIGKWEVFTGLLPQYVCKRKVEVSHPDLVDISVEPILPNWLRDYQLEGIDRAIKLKRSTLEIGTGGGKTYVAGAFAESLMVHCPVLVTVPTINLLNQTVEELEGYFFKQGKDITVGSIGEGRFKPKQVTVAIPNTLIQRRDAPEVREYLASVGGWVADECHLLSNATGCVLSYLLYKARYRLGLSATPEPGNGTRTILDGIHGKVCYRVSPQNLIERGRILKPKIHFHAVSDKGALLKMRQKGKALFKGRNLDQVLNGQIEKWMYATFFDYLIADNDERNEVVAKVAHQRRQEGRTVLLIVQKVDTEECNQAEILARVLLEKYGESWPIIKGNLPKKERERLVSAIKEGELRAAIVGPKSFREGMDVPSIEAIVYACGGKDTNSTLQRIGRGLRAKDGKRNPTIDDFEDTFRFFGKHSRLRRQLYLDTYGEDCIV